MPKSLRLWPRSLQGQVLLAIALALLVAQTISAVLIWREQVHRREVSMVSSAAFRLVGPSPEERRRRRGDGEGRPPALFRLEQSEQSLQRPGERRLARVEHELAEVLSAQGVDAAEVVVFERNPRLDPPSVDFWKRNRRKLQLVSKEPMPKLVIASIRRQSGGWTSTRVFTEGREMRVLAPLVGQTIVLYLLLVGTMAVILRRMARPLKALTRRVEDFAGNRTLEGQLQPEGPEDIQGLIVAHNAMETRIAAMLDEKDVMLGAIGHDLKTPLAALRVRIEAVEDDTERRRMAATIEDINRSLDDILSLARVGRPTDPVEPTELSALVADVIGEFEDMGEPVELGDTDRIVLPVRATWMRRALRNLVSNAMRYGQRARVSLHREGQMAMLRIEDDGPGIPEHEITRMMEPFTRLDASRNSGLGGTGLGLTLARAIADQHGGTLTLANRRGPDGQVQGLTATVRLPIGG
ncbi:MAG: two-component sensor histidine kinase [Novosphingobium sp. 28-62-57]|uniref:sensor histidine kinase n=1 Tax=unclassified Novosphingobium TaxID=2644732 RepID=UPI000BCD7F02|nr:MULTISPECIES: ATP-binding protein [unclassified Novosphingobium]OYW50563.1 MAG: two-component sensor histidine kinase [Novosphingobium sp. 12-62-10]OYZ11365.1 MAG: two-component sensor histidine kinase [Novosphingobium sp. 28-62-57]OZA37448.1 MAG: two-component sensor histidine kinase [Novosphingobium sp. 17-62-9]HQS70275.1 ATP-binding protein [Novosphingobium sp.]